jgi:hypothetical protein
MGIVITVVDACETANFECFEYATRRASNCHKNNYQVLPNLQGNKTHEEESHKSCSKAYCQGN